MDYKISIITVTLNAKNELLETIQSIQEQTYQNFQHIIKDGLSSDGTLSLDFGKYKNTFIYKMNDIGIYDAMNQGFEYAVGDLIMFLNAGDRLISKNVLSLINASFNKNINVSCIIGYTLQKEFKNKKNSKLLGYGWPYKILPFVQFPHPSFILKRDVAKELEPLFDKKLKISADYKQQLILCKKGLLKPFYGNFIITLMPLGGASTKNYISYLHGFFEVCRFSFQIYKIRFIYILFLKIFMHFYKKSYHRETIYL